MKRRLPTPKKKTATKKEKAFSTEDQASRFEEYHAYFSKMFYDRNPAKRYPSHRELGTIVGGASISTVKRDLIALKRRHNLPIDQVPEYGGGWGYTQEVVKSPTVQMTKGHLVLICMAWKSLEGCRGTPGMEQAAEAFEKFLQALGPKMAANLRKVRDRISFWNSSHFAPVDPVVFDAVSEALIEDEELRFEYQKLSEVPVPANSQGDVKELNKTGKVSKPPKERRHVQPRHLLYYDGAWYLYTDDIPSGLERRKFMLTRMKSAQGTGRHFKPKDEFDLEEELRGMGVHNTGKERVVQLRYSGKAAELALERTYHGMLSMTENKDGTVDLALETVIAPELRRFVLGSGSGVDILEPRDFRDEMCAEAQKMAVTWSTPQTAND